MPISVDQLRATFTTGDLGDYVVVHTNDERSGILFAIGVVDGMAAMADRPEYFSNT